MEPSTQQELARLIQISWIVLIPVGVLLAMVLYKLFILLHELQELSTIARYEIAPAIKDLRLTAEHVELLTAKAVNSVKSMEDGVSGVKPALQGGVDKIKTGVSSVWHGLINSFSSSKSQV